MSIEAVHAIYNQLESMEKTDHLNEKEKYLQLRAILADAWAEIGNTGMEVLQRVYVEAKVVPVYDTHNGPVEGRPIFWLCQGGGFGKPDKIRYPEELIGVLHSVVSDLAPKGIRLTNEYGRMHLDSDSLLVLDEALLMAATRIHYGPFRNLESSCEQRPVLSTRP